MGRIKQALANLAAKVVDTLDEQERAAAMERVKLKNHPTQQIEEQEDGISEALMALNRKNEIRRAHGGMLWETWDPAFLTYPGGVTELKDINGETLGWIPNRLDADGRRLQKLELDRVSQGLRQASQLMEDGAVAQVPPPSAADFKIKTTGDDKVGKK